ncbi:MAG: hypothetical protein J7L39_00430, partial [Candidatus Aenigmarchaeota archaeon]|nr:hypothetical protein [Candidatus Aenigmarchaeota archaeon]
MVREEGWWGDLQLYLVSMGDFFNINAPLALTYKSLLRNSYFRRRVRKSDLRESLKLLYDEDKKRGCLFDLLYKTLGGRNLIPANKKEVGIIKSLMEKVSSYKSKILEKRKFSDIDFLRGIDIFSQVLSYFNARSGLNIFRTNVFCLSPLEHKRRNILLSSVRRYLPDLKKFSENWNKRC